MDNQIKLPHALIDAGISLDTHRFRYRADRDFPINTNADNNSKNIIIEEIETSSLWHSAVGALNDPFEIYARRNLKEFEQMTEMQKVHLWAMVATKLGNHGLLAFNNDLLYTHYLRDRRRLRETVEDVSKWDTSFDDFINKIRETVGIACFTSVCDSRLMWGYYCNGLSGVCLIYNTDRLEQENIGLNPVKYIDGAFEVNILDFVYKYKDSAREQTLSQIMKTKHSEWSHEVESRSVIDLNDDESGIGRLITLKQMCVDGVIVGSKVRKDVKYTIERLADTFGFKVFKADVDYQLFNVKISKN